MFDVSGLSGGWDNPEEEVGSGSRFKAGAVGGGQ